MLTYLVVVFATFMTSVYKRFSGTAIDERAAAWSRSAQVSFGECKDRHHVLRRFDGSRYTVRVLCKVLREQREQVAQSRARFALQGEVVFVHLVHFPALAVEAAAP